MAERFQTLVDKLKTVKEYVSDDGSLLINKIQQDSLNNEKHLLDLLYSDDVLRTWFFTDLSDNKVVFNQQLFGWVISSKEILPDNFTRFSNKIGLSDDQNHYISNSKSIVLSFPYKDCILEAGKEDKKKNERFYNLILAPDKIDSLLEPKMLTNSIRVTRDGETEATSITDEDNLLIRGNNLLALSTLLSRYRGKAKCIYIDPPYNTGSDEFDYNDSFNESTWLTFMINRLRLAKQLLRPDGLFFAQIDNNELAQLKMLCDEVFKDGFLQLVSVKKATTAGFKAINFCPTTVTEYILIYAKDKSKIENKIVYVPAKYSDDYNRVVENPLEPPENWTFCSLNDAVLRYNKLDSWDSIKQQYGKLWKQIVSQMKYDYSIKNADWVVSMKDLHKPSPDIQKIKDLSKVERDRVHVFHRENNSDMYFYNGRSIAFFSKKLKTIDGEKVVAEPLTNFWDDISWYDIGSEGGIELKNGKKPEKLLQRIIELSTEPGDLIIDYHLGSGTTCAAAHKMKRHYIGIEQLNYGDNDFLVRMKNVVNGDKTGISSAVSWNGGGSFVYCELKKLNQEYIDRITVAESKDAIKELYLDIINSPYISTVLEKDKAVESIDEFDLLTMDEQKSILLSILDLNMLYTPYSDLDDESSHTTETERLFNKSFYGDSDAM